MITRTHWPLLLALALGACSRQEPSRALRPTPEIVITPVVTPRILSSLSPGTAPRPCGTPKPSKNQGVQIEAIVNESGRVEYACLVTSTSTSFDRQALEAVRSWQYKPALHEGKAVKVFLSVFAHPEY